MHSDLPVPAVFAHRGASAYAPENTLAAFQLAIEQGADGIELDVSLTADGHVVVIHDRIVDNTTNGSGEVRDIELKTLKSFDAGSWFAPKFKGEKVPTLDEVLKLVGEYVVTNIELKPKHFISPQDQLPGKVATLVEKHNLESKIIFSSFNPWALVKIHRMLPSAPVGLLISSGVIGSLTRLIVSWFVHYQSLHLHFRAATPVMLQRARANGHRVFAYTVNQPEDIRRLFAQNIDGIFTDDPLLALTIRQEVT
jgi:glycerophosphoryl diester phosphodiesterase